MDDIVRKRKEDVEEEARRDTTRPKLRENQRIWKGRADRLGSPALSKVGAKERQLLLDTLPAHKRVALEMEIQRAEAAEKKGRRSRRSSQVCKQWWVVLATCDLRRSCRCRCR